MEKVEFSFSINHLTAHEYILRRATFDEYAKDLAWMLSLMRKTLSEAALIELNKDDVGVQSFLEQGMKPIEAIHAAFPDQYVDADIYSKPTERSALQRVTSWVDLWIDQQLTLEDPSFDLFFMYKVRQTDLLELDALLNYSLDHFFHRDKSHFIRFLTLSMRKHSAKLLAPEYLDTMNEWIAEKLKEPQITQAESTRTKGKIKRGREDNVTRLTLEQTALFIHCLKKTKIVLTDEYLNNKEAGLAFSMLTGYSADTLRQNISKTELSKIATAKNVEMVSKALTELKKFLEDNIQPE